MAFKHPGDPPVKSGDYSAQSHLQWITKCIRHATVLDSILRSVMARLNTHLGLTFPETVWDDVDPVQAQYPTPTMNVTFRASFGFSEGIAILHDTEEILAFVAPVGNNRIDIIALNMETGLAKVFAGTESATPSAPTGLLEDRHFEIARVYHRVGETAIQDLDSSGSGDGYITVTCVIPS